MTPAIFALLIFLAPLAYSPGPGNMIFAAMGARFGVAATWPASFGYHLATWGVTLAIGLGFGAATQAAPGVAQAVRIIGAGYVMWLALGLWRAGAVEDGVLRAARPMGFGGGMVLLIFNPKAYVIIALMFSQFANAPGLGVVGVATVFTLNNMLAFALWAAIGTRLARIWSRPDQAALLNRGLAAMLGAVAVWMVRA
ncbi:LysE family translocator [uncultured Roseovarius sp.]|uniref:LysE family translocator n=1 Tax=Roseovarius sp. TaxID=1486281 RepID=UPI0025FDA228|nr:LysE family transporter [uncultured Roseovarius sp.]